MADNVTLDAGSGGAAVRTDDDGTAHWQYVKLAFGADNTQTIVSTSNPVPVDLRTDNLPGNLDVNLAASAATVTVDGSGVTQPISHAGLTELAAAINASSQLDVNIAAQAADLTIADGGNSITVDGTVTANLGATDNAVLDQIEVNTSYGDNTGGGTEAGALRVTIANDSTGVVSVDDNGGALTVDGTVTANLSATDNAVLDNIDTNTSKGASHYRNIDANAEDAIKGSAGTLHWIHAMNMTAAVAYLHLYDATTANVTPGSTTPDFTFPLPTQGDTNGAGFFGRLEHAFANAITLVVTTTTDGSAGDPGTNGVFVNAGYT